ncbi:MAG: hypothetical protein ABF785_04530 [Acetobacter papayae]|uniref:hypothetical protein n=1 Tax=Acetobacter papayae TaxID=1076592 RepID=UPI0039ED5F9A
MAVSIKSAGGAGLANALKQLQDKLGQGAHVRVGFLEDATYPDGTPVAYIASIQEFGGVAEIPEREQEVYRSLNKSGYFNKRGRFVRKEKSNFATTHIIPAHTVTIPPRPFMRNTIANNRDEWGKMLGDNLKKKGYNVDEALAVCGEEMTDQMKAEIKLFNDPPNAKSTIRKKGFDNPLIDDGHMWNSVSSEVKDGSE